MTKQCKLCKREIPLRYSEKEKKHFFYCDNCKIGGKGKTEKEATQQFENITIPAVPTFSSFPAWVESRKNDIISHGAGFLEKSALSKMLEHNTNYVLSADLKDAWKSEEGVKSIIYALQESINFGATIGKTGSILPFKNIVEFIPSVECFKAALTSGKNPPFKSVAIEPIHENDDYDIESDTGTFKYSLKKRLPRGEVIGVLVVATKTSGESVGELYDVERLYEKAKKHSKSYQYYLKDLAEFKKAQSEGKNYIEKRGYKFYEKDLENPYVGADSVEMLCKLAGKSFLSRIYKEKRVGQCIDENDDIAPPKAESPKSVLNNSMQFYEIEHITDAEIINDDVKEDESKTKKAGKSVDVDIDSDDIIE